MRPRSLLPGVLLLACALPGQDDFQDRYRAAMQLPKASPERREAFAQALSLFLRLPPADPDHRRWVGMAARAATEAGKDRLAAELYDRAWDLDQRSPTVLAGRLRALVATADAPRAVRLAHGLRAEAMYRETVDRALVGAELYLGFVNGAAMLLRQGHRDAGLWVFERQAQLLPRDPGAQTNLGLALRQIGRTSTARDIYRRAMELSPEPWVANDLGLLLKGIGERAAAARALKRSLDRQQVPGRGSAATNLGVLYLRAGIRVRPDPQADLSAQLAQDPQQPLARRIALDLLAREAAERKTAAAGRRHKAAE